MLSRHRSLLKKPSKLTMAIVAGGLCVTAAASSAAAVTWPAGAAPSAAKATAYFRGATGVTVADPPRSAEQLPVAKTAVAARVHLIAVAQAKRAAAARKAAARKAAAARAAAHRAAVIAAQRPAQQVRPAPKAPPAPPAPPVQTSGSAQQIAMSMLGSYGWPSSQFSCLGPLWARESGWSVTAANPDGAYGIPQALPGSKMASAGPDWQTSAATQIRWGLGYIKSLYGSPCGAWSHEEATGWY
jgi:hypothetical protein